RLLQYHPDYAFVAFPPGYNNYPIGLASVGNRIWAAVSYFDCDPDSGLYVADSVFILDTNGVRHGAFTIPDRPNVNALAEGDGVVWALYNNRNSIGTIDPAAGVVRHQFALHGRFGSPQGIVWALDRLWITGLFPDSIYGIRTDLSIDSGFAVVDWSIEFPWDCADGSGLLAWDGTHFYVLDGPCLERVDLTGASVEHHIFPFADSWPQGRQACHIAWDGTTMWAFHRDSPRPYALSRIRLP
ncbi:MAG TPA: hypothetical protein VM118_12980, partial [Acidobacteriota bacterium]|nr:hypothetical protein [Acidobacteriota bacterium]